MAGITFTHMGTMARPGVYMRTVQPAKNEYAVASDGIAACVIRAPWGAVGQVYEFSNARQARQTLLASIDVIDEAFAGGAEKVLVSRAGSGGACASTYLTDADNVRALDITCRCKGEAALSVSLTDAASGFRVLSVLHEGETLERFAIPAGGSEAAAICALTSAYLTFALHTGYAGNGTLAAVSGEKALTGGSAMTADVSAYRTAMNALTARRWNCLFADTNMSGLAEAMREYMDSIAQGGHTGFGVCAVPEGLTLAERLAFAEDLNDLRMVAVGNGWQADGETIGCVRAAARVAGMLAAAPSSRSLTHTEVDGATAVNEYLTDAEYAACCENGLLVFSESTNGVWIEDAVNTYRGDGALDAGWRKLRRCKTRFEVMDRAADTVSPMVGRVDNTPDGRAFVAEALSGLLLRMVSEGKLLSGEASVDADDPPDGDSASFVLHISDRDALEKLYLTCSFRFA